MLGIVEFHQFGMNEVFPQIFLDSISLYSPNSIIFATFNKVQNRLLLMTELLFLWQALISNGVLGQASETELRH